MSPEGEEKLKKMSAFVSKAVRQFFETMCPLPVVDGEIMINPPHAELPAFEVVGVIATTGGFKGSVSVQSLKIFTEKVGKILLGMDTISDADVNDVAGEMANIVVGGAKTIGSSAGLAFDISCPTVLRGDVRTEILRNSQVIHQTFKVDGDTLQVTSVLVE